jgi:hypothetical protein
VEILQVIAGSFPASRFVKDFVVRIALAAPMDVGKILEKEPRAADSGK